MKKNKSDDKLNENLNVDNTNLQKAADSTKVTEKNTVNFNNIYLKITNILLNILLNDKIRRAIKKNIDEDIEKKILQLFSYQIFIEANFNCKYNDMLITNNVKTFLKKIFQTKSITIVDYKSLNFNDTTNDVNAIKLYFKNIYKMTNEELSTSVTNEQLNNLEKIVSETTINSKNSEKSNKTSSKNETNTNDKSKLPTMFNPNYYPYLTKPKFMPMLKFFFGVGMVILFLFWIGFSFSYQGIGQSIISVIIGFLYVGVSFYFLYSSSNNKIARIKYRFDGMTLFIVLAFCVFAGIQCLIVLVHSKLHFTSLSSILSLVILLLLISYGGAAVFVYFVLNPKLDNKKHEKSVKELDKYKKNFMNLMNLNSGNMKNSKSFNDENNVNDDIVDEKYNQGKDSNINDETDEEIEEN